MANIIERVVKLVLDKRAAAKMEADAKSSAKRAAAGMDTGFSKLSGTFKALGATLAAAFGIRAIVNFAQESIKAALEVERVWAKLGTTVEATGQKFSDVQASIRRDAEAFQDATIHDAENFAATLDRLTLQTGDLAASRNNMGLVANLASGRFGGDLQAAADVVGKVMNGNIMMLKKMGFSVKDADEGLKLLSERMAGQATAAAGTFGGQLKRLAVMQEDFKEELGATLITGGEGANVLGTLQGAVVGLTHAIADNKDGLADWVTGGANVAITGIEGLLRGLVAVSQILMGGFKMSLGIAADGVLLFGKLTALAMELTGKFTNILGKNFIGNAFLDYAKRIKESNAELKAWGRQKLDEGQGGVLGGLNSITNSWITGNIPAIKGLPNRKPMLSRSGMALADEEAAKSAMEAEKARAEAFKTALDEELAGLIQLQEQSQLTAEDVAKLQFRLEGFYATLNNPNASAAARGAASGSIEKIQKFAKDQAKAAAEKAAKAKPEFTFDPIVAVPAEAMAQSVEVGAKADLFKSFNDQVATTQELTLAAAGMMGDSFLQMFEEIGSGGNVFASFAKAMKGMISDVARTLAKNEVAKGLAALASAFFPVPNPAAFKSAATHFAAAAAFSVVAGMAGGGGKSGSGGGGGAGLADGRSASGAAATKAPPPQQEVHIHLIGPGFNALNPEVQRVVWGATQEARQRFGGNAHVTLTRGT